MGFEPFLCNDVHSICGGKLTTEKLLIQPLSLRPVAGSYPNHPRSDASSFISLTAAQTVLSNGGQGYLVNPVGFKAAYLHPPWLCTPIHLSYGIDAVQIDIK